MDSYVRAIEIYSPRNKSLKAYYRATETGKELLNNLNNDRFCQEFRISQRNFEYICNTLRSDLEPKPNPISHNQKEATVEEKVAVCLYKLKSCSEYQVVGNIFGFGKSTVHKFFYEVVRAIVNNLSAIHIKMPNLEESDQIAAEFQKITRFKPILGAIDCTHIPVTVPLEGMRDFLNRKGWTSIVLQAVADHNYRFIDVSCKFPGNVHDATVLKGSDLFHRHDQIFPISTYFIGDVNIPYLLLGDPAYPLLSWILKDYPGANLDERKVIFNLKLNRGRVKIEQAFGILKSCWRILSRRSEIDVNFMPFVVAACCTLHNIVREDSFPHLHLAQNNINEFIQSSDENDVPTTESTLPEAEAIRNAITNKLYEYNEI